MRWLISCLLDVGWWHISNTLPNCREQSGDMGAYVSWGLVNHEGGNCPWLWHQNSFHLMLMGVLRLTLIKTSDFLLLIVLSFVLTILFQIYHILWKKNKLQTYLSCFSIKCIRLQKKTFSLCACDLNSNIIFVDVLKLNFMFDQGKVGDGSNTNFHLDKST